MGVGWRNKEAPDRARQQHPYHRVHINSTRPTPLAGRGASTACMGFKALSFGGSSLLSSTVFAQRLVVGPSVGQPHVSRTPVGWTSRRNARLIPVSMPPLAHEPGLSSSPQV